MDEAIKKKIEDKVTDWKNFYPGSAGTYRRGLDEGYGLAQEEIEKWKLEHDFEVRLKESAEKDAVEKNREITRLTAQNEKMKGLLRQSMNVIDELIYQDITQELITVSVRTKFDIESILNDK
jgi:hypothetical protein